MADYTYASIGHLSVGQPESSEKTKILASDHNKALLAQERIFRFGWASLHAAFLQLSSTDSYYVDLQVPPFCTGFQLEWYTTSTDATLALEFDGSASKTVPVSKNEFSEFSSVINLHDGIISTTDADSSIRLKLTASAAMDLISFTARPIIK